jgi:hypothetical protein
MPGPRPSEGMGRAQDCREPADARQLRHRRDARGGRATGIVSIALVRRAKQLGYLVGSCSDRPISYQQALWERLHIIVDFTVLKHRLADVKARFAAAAYYHIGDSDLDRFFAVGAGFRFLRAEAAAHRSWGPELFAESPGGHFF